DILGRMGQLRHQGELPNCEVLVGFCAETSELEHHARLKLETKGLDLIVGNLVGVEDSGFDVDTNRAIILTPEGKLPVPDLQSKRQLARTLLDAVAERL
ncbi:MAG TPA: phosphopantothenoylcysteine decarboxylase, partial [Actinomycetota bacterium]|nr:phosphopantothenoylcysteine decarboxylase [Actinomycetota bacterium]